MKYTNNTVGKMKIYDEVLKKTVLLERGETYETGKSTPKKEQVVQRTKPESNTNFKEELKKIKGIGNETVKDILNIYPTKAHLISAVRKGDSLSFRNDISAKLKRRYE